MIRPAADRRPACDEKTNVQLLVTAAESCRRGGNSARSVRQQTSVESCRPARAEHHREWREARYERTVATGCRSVLRRLHRSDVPQLEAPESTSGSPILNGPPACKCRVFGSVVLVCDPASFTLGRSPLLRSPSSCGFLPGARLAITREDSLARALGTPPTRSLCFSELVSEKR